MKEELGPSDSYSAAPAVRGRLRVSQYTKQQELPSRRDTLRPSLLPSLHGTQSTKMGRRHTACRR